MPLPTFIIAGERRCGSTALSHALAAHPDVYLHPAQDLQFFIDDAVKGRGNGSIGDIDEAAWNRAHDAAEYALMFAEAERWNAIGEKSADYLFWRPAHRRIAQMLPETRFVITLRHPVERAWSHYWNEVGKGRETLSFDEALAVEDARCRSSAYARNHLSYRTRGFYDENLRALFDHVAPDRVLVITLEERMSQPKQTLQRIYDFIGVDPKKGLERAGSRYNANWTTLPRKWSRYPGLRSVESRFEGFVRNAVGRMSNDRIRGRDIGTRILRIIRRTKDDLNMPEATRTELLSVYAPHVRALEVLLDRSFSEWDLSTL